jgi:hypothetical protein
LVRKPIGESGVTKDPFTLFHEWANKPLDSLQTIDSEIHEAIMSLSEEDRMDREKVNKAVRAIEYDKPSK